MIIEESKTATSMEEDAPFVEELTEDEYMHEVSYNLSCIICVWRSLDVDTTDQNNMASFATIMLPPR